MYSNDMQEDVPWLPACTVMEVGKGPSNMEVKIGVLRKIVRGLQNVSECLQEKFRTSRFFCVGVILRQVC